MIIIKKQKRHVQYKFNDKKINLFTCGFTICPPRLKTLSDGTLVPEMHKYFMVRCDNEGNRLHSAFHHTKGLVSASAIGNSLYELISLSTCYSCVIGVDSTLSFSFSTFLRIAERPLSFFRWRRYMHISIYCVTGTCMLLPIKNWLKTTIKRS